MRSLWRGIPNAGRGIPSFSRGYACRPVGAHPVGLLLTAVLIAGAYQCAEAWRCDVPTKDAPMPVGWDGSNPYCMSVDGKTCWTSIAPSCQQKITDVQAGKKKVSPLVCGKALKSAAGVSGYESPTHWCSQAQAFFSKPLRDCAAKGLTHSYGKKACVRGRAGGAQCSQNSDCASGNCVFTCSLKGLCGHCKSDGDCPSGSKCWVTSGIPTSPFGSAVPMCGLSCRPEIGHVCACGVATAASSRPCPQGYYCSNPSYGDGCGPVPNTSYMQRCLKRSNRLGIACEDIEGNLEPDTACDGPQGQPGVCLPTSISVFGRPVRHCTHKCTANTDCTTTTSSVHSRAVLCDTHKLFHKPFTTCVLAAKSPLDFEPCTAAAETPCKADPAYSSGKFTTSCVFPRALTNPLHVKGAAYGVCSPLCPKLQLGAPCGPLDPNESQLKSLVCTLVDTVGKGSSKQVKACINH